MSRQTISTIADKVVEGMVAWRNRPLDVVHPAIFIDAIRVKVRDGQVANKPVRTNSIDSPARVTGASTGSCASWRSSNSATTLQAGPTTRRKLGA